MLSTGTAGASTVGTPIAHMVTLGAGEIKQVNNKSFDISVWIDTVNNTFIFIFYQYFDSYYIRKRVYFDMKHISFCVTVNMVLVYD